MLWRKIKQILKKGDRIWSRVIKYSFSEEVTFEDMVSTWKSENEIMYVLYQFYIETVYLSFNMSLMYGKKWINVREVSVNY